ncbi:MAG: MlaD family protein [Lentisphaeria bacterium]|nr:MlaD family protein [Lentisphaeria bacterium]
MNIKKNFLLGIFVISALIVGIIMLIGFGLLESFRPKVYLVTYTNESVQGVNIGSQVKFRGVSVGSVENISILSDNKLIKIEMSITPDAFIFRKMTNEEMRKNLCRKMLQDEIKSGLNCRLDYAGITGLRYVELDFFTDNGIIKDVDPVLSHEQIYIPMVPSVFSSMFNMLNESLTRISKIKFEEMSDNIIQSLNEIRAIFNSDEVKNTIVNIETISNNLEKVTSSINGVLSKEKLEALIGNLEEAIKSFERLGKSAESELLKSDIPSSSRQLRDTLQNILELKGKVENTLFILNKVLDNISSLSRQIEEQPDSLLRGRNSTPLDYAEIK